MRAAGWNESASDSVADQGGRDQNKADDRQGSDDGIWGWHVSGMRLGESTTGKRGIALQESEFFDPSKI